MQDIPQNKFRRFKSFLAARFVFLNGIISIIVLALIMAFLIANSIKFFSSYPILEFLTGQNWSPTVFEDFGFVPLFAGSLAVTFGAILIAIPLGIGSSIYIGELAPKAVREVLKPVIEVLATIPSVVIGFIGIKIAAPFIRDLFNLSIGLTALTGSVMLAFMSLPTIISISEDAINAVPDRYRHASVALGATKWETTIGISTAFGFFGRVRSSHAWIGKDSRRDDGGTYDNRKFTKDRFFTSSAGKDDNRYDCCRAGGNSAGRASLFIFICYWPDTFYYYILDKPYL